MKKINNFNTLIYLTSLLIQFTQKHQTLHNFRNKSYLKTCKNNTLLSKNCPKKFANYKRNTVKEVIDQVGNKIKSDQSKFLFDSKFFPSFQKISFKMQEKFLFKTLYKIKTKTKLVYNDYKSIFYSRSKKRKTSKCFTLNYLDKKFSKNDFWEKSKINNKNYKNLLSDNNFNGNTGHLSLKEQRNNCGSTINT